MTKERARQRAKAKAADKAKKRAAGDDRPIQKGRPGHFDPGTHSISSPVANAGGPGLGRTGRGSARSR